MAEIANAYNPKTSTRKEKWVYTLNEVKRNKAAYGMLAPFMIFCF